MVSGADVRRNHDEQHLGQEIAIVDLLCSRVETWCDLYYEKLRGLVEP